VRKIAWGIVLCFGLGWAASAEAGKGTYLHFAAFFSTNGPGTVQYPDRVPGEDIEGALLKKGAEMLLFAHSVSIKDGDVITIANDTLREKGSSYADFGLDCQFTVHDRPVLRVGGLCNIFVTDKKHAIVIKPVEIRKRLVWIKVFEEKAQGVAGYLMAEEGADLARSR